MAANQQVVSGPVLPAAGATSVAAAAGGAPGLPGAAGPPSAAAPSGITHAPIEIGFMYSLNNAAASAGVNNHVTIDPGSVVHALVASYDATGGMGGRRIEPVYEELQSASNNYQGDLAAACAAFTQDHHVAAVISNLGYYSESFLGCLAKASVPVISSDAGPDYVDARQFPLLVTPDSLLGDTREVEVVTRLSETGWLAPADRVGVVIEGCPISQRIFTDALAPALQRSHLTLAATAQTQCFQGISDLGTISGQMTDAVVAFRAKGVSRVMFVSEAQEGTIAYEFMLAAGNQQWYPGYALSSASDATDLQAQSGVSQQEIGNSRGVGWIPPFDTVDMNQAPTTTTARQCLSRVRSQGLQPSTENDFLTLDSVCDTFVVYDEILRATGGDASPASFLRGLGSLGTSFVSALDLNGRTSPWDDGRLSPADGRLFAYLAARGGFVYTGSAFAF